MGSDTNAICILDTAARQSEKHLSVMYTWTQAITSNPARNAFCGQHGFFWLMVQHDLHMPAVIALCCNSSHSQQPWAFLIAIRFDAAAALRDQIALPSQHAPCPWSRTH